MVANGSPSSQPDGGQEKANQQDQEVVMSKNPRSQMSWWQFSFGGLQALCAVTITTLTIWGLFFTDLPEALVSQLRSDIRDAREELADLRREKRAVADSLASQNLTLARTQDALHDRNTKLIDLETSIGALDADLERVLEERRIYSKRVYSEVAVVYFSDVGTALSDLRAELTLAVDYERFLNWRRKAEGLVENDARIERELVHVRESMNSNFQPKNLQEIESRTTAIKSAFSELHQQSKQNAEDQIAWRDSIPKGWRYAESRGWSKHIILELEARVGGSNSRLSPGILPPYHYSMAEEFVARLEAASASPSKTTGAAILRRFLKIEVFQQLLPAEKDQFYSTVNKFIEEHNAVLDDQINVQVFGSWTPKELYGDAHLRLKSLDSVFRLIEELRLQIQATYEDTVQLRGQ